MAPCRFGTRQPARSPVYWPSRGTFGTLPTIGIAPSGSRVTWVSPFSRDAGRMTYSGPIQEHAPPRATSRQRSAQVARAGVSFGSALAITISWSLHHSILWAIVHGFFSWLYVVYYAITRAA